MVKITITLEGEDLTDIVEELMHIGTDIIKSNRKEIKEIMKVLADEALDVMLEPKVLEKGAQLYKKINTEINWTYKRDRQ